MRPNTLNDTHEGAGALLSQPAEPSGDTAPRWAGNKGAFFCWEQSPAARLIRSNIQKVKDLHLEGTKYAASGSQSPHFSSSASP